MRYPFSLLLTTLLTFGFSLPGWAAGKGQPEPWQLSMQEMVTPGGQAVADFQLNVLIVILPVVFVVAALLVFVMIRFNARANPTPSKTSHNTLIEVIWTVVPVLLLVSIAVPSFRLLYLQREIPEVDFTIKATGSQWYWTYDYPDHGDISFDSFMKPDDGRGPEDPRLLATDNPVVLPVNKTIRLIVTSADVLHAWAIPAFGAKIDAVPGRLNELWFRVEKTGVYYGQCSELCGKDHAFMPIEVRVVSQPEFDNWVMAKQAE